MYIIIHEWHWITTDFVWHLQMWITNTYLHCHSVILSSHITDVWDTTVEKSFKFFIYQFAKWSDPVFYGKGGRCCWIQEERHTFFLHPTPYSDRRHKAERNRERALNMTVTEQFVYVCIYECVYIRLHVCMRTCFFSSFCVSFRSVVVFAPLRSLSSKAPWARVKMDPGGIHFCPDSRLMASCSHAYTNSTQQHCDYLKLLHIQK